MHILLTRPLEDSHEIIFKFQSLGHNVSHLPLMNIESKKYETIDFFLNSLVGKFIILGLTWSFLFQILSEIRHLIMDLGYGFEIQTSKITGLIVIIGSIILTIIFYIIGKNFI